jgi:metal-sulfur cluster biosynthetic enzyme
VEPDDLDEPPDGRLRTAQPQRHAAHPQALRKTREVDHQRRIGEVELAEVHDHVARGLQRAGERPTAPSDGRPVLVPRDPQDGQVLVERDDPGTLLRTPGFVHRPDEFPTKVGPTLIGMVEEEDVVDALSNVIDPELGLDFVELGLVYGIEIDGGTVTITFTLTTPACPIGPQVSEQMQEFVGEVPGVEQVVPNMVFTPAWTPDKMSEDAKFALGY